MASSIENLIERAGIILHDTTNVRWQEDELLKWVNDAQTEVVLFRPDASVTSTTLSLAAGTKQYIPGVDDVAVTPATVPATYLPAGIRLIDVPRNVSATSLPSDAITVVDRAVLDAQLRSWQSVNTKTSVEHYSFDLRDPKVFYVYPGVLVGTKVDIVYSSVPVVATDVTEDLAIPLVYSNAVLDYVLYRAYSKDADFAGNAQRALHHYEAFTRTLGLKFQVDQMVDPNAQGANTVPPQ
jgi:hypothetical protein